MEEGSGGERGEKERESKRQRQRDRDQDLKAIAETLKTGVPQGSCLLWKPMNSHLFVFVSLVAEGSWQLRDVMLFGHCISARMQATQMPKSSCAMKSLLPWEIMFFDTCLVTGENAPNKKLSEQNLKLFIAQDLVFW